MTAANLLTLDALKQRRHELETRNAALGAAIDRLDALIDARTGSRTTDDHGTSRRYRRGCRCGSCRKANTTAQRAYRRRRANREEPT